MELITRSSRARVVGRESSESRCAYVMVDGELARLRSVSWRSFSSWASDNFGTFVVAKVYGLARGAWRTGMVED